MDWVQFVGELFLSVSITLLAVTAIVTSLHLRLLWKRVNECFKAMDTLMQAHYLSLRGYQRLREDMDKVKRVCGLLKDEEEKEDTDVDE
jgi:hypothetical protein